jgi:hypothetical protein
MPPFHWVIDDLQNSSLIGGRSDWPDPLQQAPNIHLGSLPLLEQQIPQHRL